jgi:hypothetical protein
MPWSVTHFPSWHNRKRRLNRSDSRWLSPGHRRVLRFAERSVPRSKISGVQRATTVHKPPSKGRESVGPRATRELTYANVMGSGRSRRNAKRRSGCFLHAPATCSISPYFTRVCGATVFSLHRLLHKIAGARRSGRLIEVVVEQLRGCPSLGIIFPSIGTIVGLGEASCWVATQAVSELGDPNGDRHGGIASNVCW